MLVIIEMVSTVGELVMHICIMHMYHAYGDVPYLHHHGLSHNSLLVVAVRIAFSIAVRIAVHLLHDDSVVVVDGQHSAMLCLHPLHYVCE